MAGPATHAHLDTLARQMGYRDYATYSAYQQQQAMMRERANVVGQGTVGGGTPPTAPPPAQNQPPQNWLQKLMWGLSGGHY